MSQPLLSLQRHWRPLLLPRGDQNRGEQEGGGEAEEDGELGDSEAHLNCGTEDWRKDWSVE